MAYSRNTMAGLTISPGTTRRESMIIREASSKEADLLSKIAIQSKGHWGYDDWFLNACKQGLTLTEQYIEENPTFVIEKDHKIHGFYSLLLVKHKVDFFFISPDSIGQGIGKKLWEHLIQSSTDFNLSFLTIDCDPHAEGFYKKMGAKRIGETESMVFPSLTLPHLKITFEKNYKTRSEEEMMKLILNYGESHSNIRGAIMNGSRVNPNVEPDQFQDYDIVYFVKDTKPFENEKNVIPHFGEVMIMEKPEDKLLPAPLGDGRFTYLIQFMDGNRIDMHFVPLNKREEAIKDSLTEVILDKDDLFPELPAPSDKSYWIEPPTEKLYQDCCNSFIWGLGSHIPKTVYRRELPLLMTLIDVVLREPLVHMLKWHIGLEKGYRVSIGKGGKYLEKWLEPEIWDMYTQTYSNSEYQEIWKSLVVFHDLFKELALNVGRAHGYSFPHVEMERAQNFLKSVRRVVENP